MGNQLLAKLRVVGVEKSRDFKPGLPCNREKDNTELSEKVKMLESDMHSAISDSILCKAEKQNIDSKMVLLNINKSTNYSSPKNAMRVSFGRLNSKIQDLDVLVASQNDEMEEQQKIYKDRKNKFRKLFIGIMFLKLLSEHAIAISEREYQHSMQGDGKRFSKHNRWFRISS